jgi:hypothetical protein
MPWILGLETEKVRETEPAACAALLGEPWEVSLLEPAACYSNRWEKPNTMRSRRVTKRYSRGAFDLHAPEAKGGRATLHARDERMEIRDVTEETVVAYLGPSGEPVDLGAVSFSDAELEAIGSEELTKTVARSKMEGRASIMPEDLRRVEERRVVRGEPVAGDPRELQAAWMGAARDPRTGAPERLSAWQTALQRGLPSVEGVLDFCPLCEKGSPACLREVWIDATGLLELEAFLALAIEPPPNLKAGLASVFQKFPKRALKLVKGNKAALAERYAKVLKKYFQLMPSTPSALARAMMASLFCNAPPSRNVVNPDARDAWLKDLDGLLEREDEARLAAMGALGDDKGEDLMDHFLILGRLRFHLNAAAQAKAPLPLAFTA